MLIMSTAMAKVDVSGECVNVGGEFDVEIFSLNTRKILKIAVEDDQTKLLMHT